MLCIQGTPGTPGTPGVSGTDGMVGEPGPKVLDPMKVIYIVLFLAWMVAFFKGSVGMMGEVGSPGEIGKTVSAWCM